ncbi:hypothetical protein R6Q59_021831 [Mikania micrantha]|uniref:Phylloplanin n=1 Tax=Mikania micrantha TaxID=192012 RepID=A0A5N6MUZ1_9ASTR|nr:hypothetical protein E3N88_26844 [Mikania micrantha]KAD4178255.1 hypothetical protein E3N88_26846 [Mikania micrantha]
MAMKYISLIIVLVVVLVTPQAEAQLFPPIGLTTVLNVSGVVGCSLNGSINSAPPFQNALVNLVCGGSVIASNTTNQSGAFTIFLNPIQTIIALLSGSCKVVVATSLATCNSTLPSTGTLQAPVQILGNTIVGTLNILTGFVSGLFSFIG